MFLFRRKNSTHSSLSSSTSSLGGSNGGGGIGSGDPIGSALGNLANKRQFTFAIQIESIGKYNFVFYNGPLTTIYLSLFKIF